MRKRLGFILTALVLVTAGFITPLTSSASSASSPSLRRLLKDVVAFNWSHTAVSMTMTLAPNEDQPITKVWQDSAGYVEGTGHLSTPPGQSGPLSMSVIIASALPLKTPGLSPAVAGLYARFSLGWVQRIPPDSDPSPTNTSQLNGADRLLANHWFSASVFHDVAPGYILQLEDFPLPHILLRAIPALSSNSKVSLVGKGSLFGHAIDQIEVTNDAWGGNEVLFVTTGTSPRLLRANFGLDTAFQPFAVEVANFSWTNVPRVSAPKNVATMCSIYNPTYDVGLADYAGYNQYPTCPGYVPPPFS